MNTDFPIQEEIDMKPSKATQEESDFMELARIAEMGIADQQTDSADVAVSEVSLPQDLGVESLTEKKQVNPEIMESAEAAVMKTAEEAVDTTETAELYEAISPIASNQCEEQSVNKQNGNETAVISDFAEQEAIAEIINKPEAETTEMNDGFQSISEQANEESLEATQDKVDLAAIPDAVLMDAVEEISHHNVEKTPSEDVTEDKTAKNEPADKTVIDQVGHLTRNLHNSLRELGYDKRLQSFATEVPEAQDKLSYVASKTEQAADRTLNATEIAMPIQEKLAYEATQLSAKWKRAFEEQREQPDTEKFKLLLIETLGYIDKVPEQTDATNAQLMEIMMAQDFQDLTGQVIKKITYMVQRLEHDLVQLLLANVPISNKPVSSEEGLMNGPVVNPEKSPDTLNSQDQVDDLLASLGF